jgi:hypothetical protein
MNEPVFSEAVINAAERWPKGVSGWQWCFDQENTWRSEDRLDSDRLKYG